MVKYFKHKLENFLVVNKIVTLHYAKIDKDFSYMEEEHDFWEIVFTEKENIICTADGKEINLKQGEMLFHKPLEKHALICDGIHSPQIFILSFVSRSPSMRFFENKTVRLTKEQIKYVYSIVEEGKKTFDIPFFNPDMKKMNLLPRPTLGGEQLIKNRLEFLLIDVMRTLTETDAGNEIFLSETELENKFAGEVIKILKENLYGKITIDDICKKTSYCRAYVFKNFKSATGKSVMQYYTELKIKEAKTLLKENELSVREISDKLCFDTPNYFTKTFKKAVGLTPTAYRKRAGL